MLGSSSVAASASRRVGLLRIRAENTLLVNEIVLNVDGHGVARLALLNPGDESVPDGRGLSAVAAGAVRQAGYLEQTVKVWGIGVPLQHLVIVMLHLFEGDELVGLQIQDALVDEPRSQLTEWNRTHRAVKRDHLAAGGAEAGQVRVRAADKAVKLPHALLEELGVALGRVALPVR